MSEKAQAVQLRLALQKSGAHIQRIENLIGAGTPDLNICVNGNELWIETKNIKSWPKRIATTVRFPHPFSKEQRIWFTKRIAASGKPLLYLRVEEAHAYLFFSADSAINFVDVEGGWNRDEMIRGAAFYASDRCFPAEDITRFLAFYSQSRFP